MDSEEESKIVTLNENPTWKNIASENSFNMSPEEKRHCCDCKPEFVTLDQIPTWKDITKEYQKNDKLNEKVSIFDGDITTLVVDAIVNATDSALSGGGGVDRAIHKAAGRSLFHESRTYRRLQTGDAKITYGYKLPAKYVIHTAGPNGLNNKLLENCYKNSLHVALENKVRSIAFPCISTGNFGYPHDDAAHVALRAVRNFLEAHESSIDRIVFCLFLRIDIEIYQALMKIYFPS